MLIISASNVVTSGENSQSIQLAKLAYNILKDSGVESEIVDLRNFKIDCCDMCESCFKNQICIKNDQFNEIRNIWNSYDNVLIICPHYAAVPSKLVAIIEKLQEMAYLNYCNGKAITLNKNVVIVAHGGMTENYDNVYKENILTPLANMLKSIGCSIVNDIVAEPLCFGVKKYHNEKEISSICFRKENDEQKSNMIIRTAIDAIFSRKNNETLINTGSKTL